MADDIVGQAPKITARITAAVERELKRRDVFPKLRAEHAPQIINGSTEVHRLSTEEAEQLLVDVEGSASASAANLRHSAALLSETAYSPRLSRTRYRCRPRATASRPPNPFRRA